MWPRIAKRADWPAVAGDVGAMKYSPADQITPANVSQLTQAWTYPSGGPAPIVVGNLMYFVAGETSSRSTPTPGPRSGNSRSAKRRPAALFAAA